MKRSLLALGGGVRNRFRNRLLLVLMVGLALSCATRSYAPQPLDSVGFRSRAQTEQEGGVRVTAAVPSPEEAEAIFGIPVYDTRMQPIWLEIENKERFALRYAPVGTDPLYFSPLEVAWKHRGPFDKEGRLEMEKRLHELAMPRTIRPGETRSGFVFTHASPGTKNFNVDLFGEGPESWSFAFFVPVPGFEPDHSEVYFRELYTKDEMKELDLDAFREILAATPCCTTDQASAGVGAPINVVMVGEGEEVLGALIRAGWYEVAGHLHDDDAGRSQFFYGRPPDAVFRIQRGTTGDRNQLNVWMSPLRVDGLTVWMAQISHYVGQTTELGRALFDARLDPDIDDARNYMLQIQWYSQGLVKHGWQETGHTVPINELRAVFGGSYYFTDGYRAVMWLSGETYSMLETGYVDWDPPPRQ